MKWIDEYDKQYTDDAFDAKARHRKIEKYKTRRMLNFFGMVAMFILTIMSIIFWGLVVESVFVWLAAFLLVGVDYKITKTELRHLLILDRLMEKESIR